MNRIIGVVLSVLDFRESDRIVTVFSPGGLIKFFVKRNRSSLMTVLTEGEFIYTQGKGDLHRFKEGTLFNQYLKLRERLENLEAAGQLIHAVLKSQFPGKAAPQLYELFCYFLQMIPEVDHPMDLVSIFQIKTLVHEGLFQQSHTCTMCDAPPFMRFGGERFCKAHAPNGAIHLNEEQELHLLKIVEGRSLKELLTKKPNLTSEIKNIFIQSFWPEL